MSEVTAAEWLDRLARIADRWAFDGPYDPSTPTERAMWEEHGPARRDEAREKVRAILRMMSDVPFSALFRMIHEAKQS